MKKKTQVAAKTAVEKKKTCGRLLNPALATPSRSLALGSHRKKQVPRSVKVGLHFPVGQIGRYFKDGRNSQQIGFGAHVYLTDILEYLTAEVLDVAGQAMKDSKKIRIIPRHMMLSIMRDKELSKLLADITIAQGGVLPNIDESLFGDSTAKDATKFPAEDAAKSPKKTVKSP